MWLEEIDEPADLRALSFEELEELAGEIRDFIVLAVAENGGHLGSNLGAVELTPRPAPRVRVADRRDPLGHRPPGLRAQARDRAAERFRPPAPGRRPVGIPVPGGEPARLHREQPRLDRAVLRLRDGGRPRRRHRPAPPHRRRDRRRCADRRHGVRGAEQPRPQPSPGDHRPQRQRTQLRPDGVQPLRRPTADRDARAGAGEPAGHRARRWVDVPHPHEHPPQPDVRAAPAAARGFPP